MDDVVAALADSFESILEDTPGEDPSREGLVETPMRAAQAWHELTLGYSIDVGGLLDTFDSDGYDEMVAIADLPFVSLCECHLLPFTGTAHVVYIPQGRIVGLSTLPRLVEAFARRLQVQERMTTQLAETLLYHLNPAGVMVVVEALHMCATLRGDTGAVMRTSAVRGVLAEKPEARAEALALIP